MEERKPPPHDTQVKRSELVEYVRDTDLVVVTGSGVSMQSVGYPGKPNTAVAGWQGLLQDGFEYCKRHGLIGGDDTVSKPIKRTTSISLMCAPDLHLAATQEGNTKYNWLQESIGQLKVHDVLISAG
jgi:hypothetical protein